MPLTTLLTILLLAATLTTATPLLETRQTTATPPALYYLQTSVVNGDHKDCGSDKNNLWVYSYHTGAGLGDAALSSNKTYAMEAYLNGTQQLFTYPGDEIGGWPMAIAYGPYQEWSTVTISIAETPEPSQGFFFNSTGLQYNGSVNGWLACDWWHGVPQLFNVDGEGYGPIAKSCSKVNLLPVAV